jgi:hypothetical protein
MLLRLKQKDNATLYCNDIALNEIGSDDYVFSVYVYVTNQYNQIFIFTLTIMKTDRGRNCKSSV